MNCSLRPYLIAQMFLNNFLNMKLLKKNIITVKLRKNIFFVYRNKLITSLRIFNTLTFFVKQEAWGLSRLEVTFSLHLSNLLEFCN